ncbi:MAG: NitT/TauT family transport system ATP-binding protein [Clostridiales bacterium]|jgi:NitT/TauT family transport system ATP-binding protein|nr:NitT/TauT family transport system ATP-binding protein [Clostridiales bacterium]MDK2933789.1 NitT/TauT family transport system ATP-binding protein [Clostridiales bacterium]
MIKITNLTKQYINNGIRLTALDGLNLTVSKGEICSIIGPSGCGKTTLLYILAGIIKEYEGKVSIHNLSPDSLGGTVGLILQDYGLLPWKTVWQNVVLGLEIKKVSKKEQEERGEKALQKVGLAHLKHLYPSQLSGGQKQRVAIARALSMNVNVLLMDEPFSALDAMTREEAQEIFLDLWKRSNMTVVLVTHNIEEAVYLGNKIVVMSPSPGKISYEILNPHQGKMHIRSHPIFYQLCARIRQHLKK